MRRADSGPRSVIPRTRTARRQFSFGGVAFEVLADKTLQWQLPEAFERYVREPGAGADPVLADVICSVSVERTLAHVPEARDGAPSFRDEPDRITVFSSELRAELSRIAPTRYAAAASVTPGASGLSALLLGVSSAIVQIDGGLSLNALALAFAQRAFLLLEPQAASTIAAAELCPEATVLSARQVHLAFHGSQMLAFALPAAVPSSLVASDRTSLPVAAVLRACAATDGPAILPLTAAQSTALIRDALEANDVSASGQTKQQQRIAQFCQHVPVCELHYAAGQPIDPLVRERFLSAQATRDVPDTPR